MRDSNRDDLENRVDVAKSLCVHALKDLLQDEARISPITDDARRDARRALTQYSITRRNLISYDLAMANPQQPEPKLPCGKW